MAMNRELREFLRSRRARVQPEDVGVPHAGHRRVPGLRREEVAMLAGVSADYYTRLEQGRHLQPSDQVLDAIARALRLSGVEQRHLHNLVRSTVTAREQGQALVSPLDAGTRMLLDSLQIPAIVVDVRGDVQAMNLLGRALLPGLEPLPSVSASHPRWLFLDSTARDLLVEWEMVARLSVGVLRQAAGRYPRDSQLHALVGELSVVSPEFRTWWAEHDVDAHCRGPKRFHHPVVGEIVAYTEAMQIASSESWLYAYAAEPGSPSAEALSLLGALAATSEIETMPQENPGGPHGIPDGNSQPSTGKPLRANGPRVQ
ncbi:helix-turn-helix transcriptional regulator [Streptomyces brasiliensis]|uniref:Transcriptional regulator n=1 Tax=Streptomyces brasiliensis TaxID=1954 RepID=A0A917K944_9ACTN|nr:helix-turn-helix transcriptional regulator [Streptomyces brasiliensis]GGJ03597.1 transcriptional regulator [Streptomyces brasiliensis]